MSKTRPIVRFVNKVMLDAIRRGASDIHFEPYEKIYRVRLRMDGVLKELAQPPVQLAQKLSARLKVMARLDIAERRVPQDGRIKMKLSKNRAIDFRVSSCPTLFGEKIVMRILDPTQASLGIDSLGYEPFQKELYTQLPCQAAGHDSRHRPNRQRQDRFALYRSAISSTVRIPTSPRQKIRQKSTCRESIRSMSIRKSA